MVTQPIQTRAGLMVTKKKNGLSGEKEFPNPEGDNHLNDLSQKHCILLFVQITVFHSHEHNFSFKTQISLKSFKHRVCVYILIIVRQLTVESTVFYGIWIFFSVFNSEH